MTVFSFYLFDRTGTCLVYKEWKRTVKAVDTDDDQKNMFGMLFALRNFSQKLSPNAQAGTPHYFVTDVYALHYFETATGLRFVLTTSRDFGGRDMVRHLREIYSDIYVEFAVKNPLYVRGTPITAPFFLQRLDSIQLESDASTFCAVYGRDMDSSLDETTDFLCGLLNVSEEKV